MKPWLSGLGTAVPPLAIGQEEAGRLAAAFGPGTAAEQRIHRVLYRRTGVASRSSVTLALRDGVVTAGGLFRPPSGPGDPGPGTAERLSLYEREAPGLAVTAAKRALAAAGAEPDAVDHVVVVTCTGFMAPGIDVALVRGLGLRADVGRVQVGFMGCHGAFVGLRQAAALATADPSATVLVVAVELCSLHFQYGWDPARVVANALFADGAGAAVVRGAEAGCPGGLRMEAHGSWLGEGSEDAMTWRIGDHGFRMTLSAAVPEEIRAGLGEQIGPWLEQQGLGIAGVPTWAVHPGGPRILTAVTAALDLPEGSMDVAREVLRDHGNMSSPTVLFVMERLLAGGAPRPWVALAFGPGLTTEALLLR